MRRICMAFPPCECESERRDVDEVGTSCRIVHIRTASLQYAVVHELEDCRRLRTLYHNVRKQTAYLGCALACGIEGVQLAEIERHKAHNKRAFRRCESLGVR